MRILHVIPQFPYFGGRTIVGGHASCLLTLALAQHRTGHEVTVLSYLAGTSGEKLIDGGPRAYSLFPNAKTRTLGFGLKFCRAAVQWVTRHRALIDVVHVHSGFADYLMVSGAIKAKTGLPTIHTMYCPIASQGGRAQLPGIRGFLRRRGNSLDWRGGMSKNVARSMSEYGLKSVHSIPPAVDASRLESPPSEVAELRNRLGVHPDQHLTLFVGNAKPQKNAIGVIRAFHLARADFPNSKLVITTELKHSSPDKDVNVLANEIKRLDLASHVIQLGVINNMATLMHASDLLVAPFLDSFGPSDYFMAALEAMACGKPVICSNVGGMPEIITPEVGRLVPPTETARIAEAMREFMQSKELSVETGAKARCLVNELFNPTRIVQAYDNVYRSMAR